MHCFPMLSEAYAAALLASDEGTPKLHENGAVSAGSSESQTEDVDVSAEEEDLETARTRPLRLESLESLHL